MDADDDSLLRQALGMTVVEENGDELDDLDAFMEDNPVENIPFLLTDNMEMTVSNQYINANRAVAVGSNSAVGTNSPAGLESSITGRCPTLLYLSCNPDVLSEYQCLVRKQIELFEAREVDLHVSAQGRNKPIVLGQVGIRCRHCASLPMEQRARASTLYPSKLQNIYQAAQNIAVNHLQSSCWMIPDSIRKELCSLKDKKTRKGGGKELWGKMAAVLGVYENEHALRFVAPADLHEHRQKVNCT